MSTEEIKVEQAPSTVLNETQNKKTVVEGKDSKGRPPRVKLEGEELLAALKNK